MPTQHVYKVVFLNQGKVYELYAREVSQGSLFGFVEVGEFIFGERSAIVVDPAEERMQAEFSGVNRTYIPMHAILRIDEVEKEGINKVTSIAGDNVTPFPMPLYTPGGPNRRS